MNSLPQELVYRISKYLGRGDLKDTLLLSTEFQYAAEQYSGAFTKYSITENNAEKFRNIYEGRFFQYLRKVKFRTSVPALDDAQFLEENTCRDTADELLQMDREFTRQIHFLFATRQNAEERGVHELARIEMCIYTPTRAMDRELHCGHRIFTSWRMHLLSPETLPSLRSVQCLHVKNGSKLNYPDNDEPPLRQLDLRVLVNLSISVN